MSLEQHYQEILAHTQGMLELARQQDWNALTEASEQQRQLAEKAVTHTAIVYAPERHRITAIIRDIEQINSEILERVQTWQQHVKILLRLDKPTPNPSP